MYHTDMDDAGDFWAGCVDSPSISPSAGSKLSIRQASSRPTIKSPSVVSISRSFSPGSSPSEADVAIEPVVSAPEPSVVITPADAEDDSYWGLYSSIGGTADSTVPSPHLQDDKHSELDMFGRPITSYGEVVTGGYFDGHGQTGGLMNSDQGDEDFFSQTTMSASDDDDDDGITHYLGVGVDLVPPRVSEAAEASSLGLQLSPQSTAAQPGRLSAKSPDEGLRTVIKGIYSMWLSQNAGGSIEDFVSIVKQTVEAEAAEP